MKRSVSLWPVAAGCALVLLANGLLLAAAAWNRRGERHGQMTLTERELALPAEHSTENTALFLSLSLAQDPPQQLRRSAFRRRYELPRTNYAWLDRDKLRELGVRIADTPPQREEDHDAPVPGTRRAFLVLELDGAAWARWLGDQEAHVDRIRRQVEDGTASSGDLADAVSVLAIDRTMRSRLVPIDAGLDEASVRSRYPDGARYAIVPGLISAGYARSVGGELELRGRVVELSVSAVCVPKEFRSRIDAFLPREAEPEVSVAWPSPQASRYQATVAFGRRNEPWLIDVR